MTHACETEFVNTIHCGDWIEVLRALPDNIFHCVVTSPPYWGQRLYWWGTDNPCDGKPTFHDWDVGPILQVCRNCGAKAPVFGVEKTPELHIEKLVEGFREVRRVLRDDGVLWLNYGDKYWGGKGQSAHGGSAKQAERFERNQSISKGHQEIGQPGWTAPGDGKHEILGPGDLIMLPARVALALQADGWILRDDVIWVKAISMCDKYSGSTMPESMNGTRWEQCRVKVGKSARSRSTGQMKGILAETESQGRNPDSSREAELQAEYKDCPGCPKCEANGGLILRRGSWRCTKAHEHLFQFVKTHSYFCDMEAVREPHAEPWRSTGQSEKMGTGNAMKSGQNEGFGLTGEKPREYNPSGRNLRNCWAINPKGYPDAHYATFPPALVEPCIKVSTSQKGVCPKCGAQYARIVETARTFQSGSGKSGNMPSGKYGPDLQGGGETLDVRRGPCVETTTLGWKATCGCGIEETVPALVGDVFLGSGTTAVVAAKLGRSYFGCEINPEYKQEHIDARIAEIETGVPVAEARAGQASLFGEKK